MPPRRTLTGKEAMASRYAEFLAAHDRTQNGREAMASCRAEVIAARDLTPIWAEFEAAKAEGAVERRPKLHIGSGKVRKHPRKERPAAARKKRTHALLRRGQRRSKHGGVSLTKPGRRTTVSGQHVRSSSTSS